MYYSDLTCYRNGDLDEIADVYPEIRNVGWLDKSEIYKKGKISEELILKLKEILFLDIKSFDDKKKGVFDEKKLLLFMKCIYEGVLMNVLFVLMV